MERDIEDGAMQRRLGRNNSAANFDKGDNLSKKRITSDDYVHQLRVKSQRKGRYGVTVPKPFSFEIRDQSANKASIREKKVNEMVMEKKIEENNMIKH